MKFGKRKTFAIVDGALVAGTESYHDGKVKYYSTESTETFHISDRVELLGALTELPTLLEDLKIDSIGVDVKAKGRGYRLNLTTKKID